ncbi:unnamed protein product [Clonostachys byssicola]|uniref:Uncharacterized protein n=1 Tax=Clonostachys byssicola TaxID=160290 RepID=A0A9N9UT64_9HYPO|nr:unnamed protein product [Clonostachys byssicola]
MDTMGLRKPGLSAEVTQTYASVPFIKEAERHTYNHAASYPTQSGRVASPFRWWTYELLFCLGAVASMAAIVAILIVYDGKPQDSWPINNFSINSMIALLATFCRTFFMVGVGAAICQGRWHQFSSRYDDKSFTLDDFGLFEHASKNPFSSLWLIWRFKGRNTACIGAALSVFALAFGPFSQQMITVRLNTVEQASSGATGAVPRVTLVNSVIGFSNSWNPISSTKLAIYNGFMAPEIDIPSTVCPTGNCTWPIVPTVGVCGACIDTTPDIKFNRSSGSYCSVTAGKLEVKGQCGVSDFGTVFKIGAGSGKVFSLEDVPLEADAPNVIAEFGAIGVPASLTPEATLNKSLAAECAVWYCLQAREVKMEMGVLTDKAADKWHKANRTNGANDPTSNVTFIDIPASFNADSKDTYGLGYMQMYGMKTYFQKTVQGNVSADGTVGTKFSSTDYAEGLHNGFDDLESWMDRLTRSMTNEARTNGNLTKTKNDRSSMDKNERYSGTALTNQAIFYVRWTWIIYPAAVVLISVLYLVLEVVRTAGMHDVRPWKDDPLMPLYLDLDEQLKQQVYQGLTEGGSAASRVSHHPLQVVRWHDGLPVGLTVRRH